MKTKSFVLYSPERIEGWASEILLRVTEKGTFHNKGVIVYHSPETIKKARRKNRVIHRQQINKTRKIWRKTKNGRKQQARTNYARRKLGFHPISLPLSIPFDWHHVNKNDVVAIQRDIHRAVSHICGDGKLEGVVG